MCGIAGFVGKNFTHENLVKMTNCLSHRGPDSSGFYYNETTNVGLGHRRLSIIDLSSHADQPMHSACGNFVIIFNGEIYNFKEVARALNISLKTSSDTEVILEAFVKWKSNFVEKLNGMFAIAIYDKQKDELFLFRDRMGIKPLYYYLQNEILIFGSEIKAIHTFKQTINLEINAEAIDDFLHLGYIPENKTIYNKVFKLPAGSYGHFVKKQFCITSYWKIEDQISSELISEEKEAKQQIDCALNSSVSYRLLSDVPLGTFLSGGVDSSLITAIAAKQRTTQLNTFSIGFKDAKHDESKFSRSVAAHLKTNHTEFILSEQDASGELESIIEGFDQPFADSSALPTYLVSKMAKKHVTVCLSGDGGDELFMGYGSYNWRKRLSNPIIWGLRKPLAFALKLSQNKNYFKAANILNAPTKNLGSHIFSQEQNFFSELELNHLLLKRSSFNPDFNESTKSVINRTLSPTEEQSFFDIKNYLKDDLLVKVDVASMMNSLEVRVPLLDHNVVKLALNIDEKLKFNPNGTQKYILKEVLYDYVPKSFFDRPKWGFSIPLEKWLQQDLHYLIDKYLNKNAIEQLGIYNTKLVLNYVFRFEKGETYLYNRLWAMIVLNKFLLKEQLS